MIAKIIEMLTGKDDLERIAQNGNIPYLDSYLKQRRVFIPIKPKQFLDPNTFTQNELLELLKQEGNELAGDSLEPWILDDDGIKRLPLYSSNKRILEFSKRMSTELNKVFALGCVEVILPDILEKIDVDFVDLNLFCRKSWAIGVKGPQNFFMNEK
jgi:hypothetical protein